MESRLEKIFSMGINVMSLAVWLGEDRKCSAAVVGLDLLLGLSMVIQSRGPAGWACIKTWNAGMPERRNTKTRNTKSLKPGTHEK